MKKRLFPILLAIVMSLSLLPVSAMAKASDWGADRPKSEIKSVYRIQNGETESPSTNFILGNGDGQLRTMPTGSEKGQSFNASAYCGVTAVSSDPDVVEVKNYEIGTWRSSDSWNGKDCLQVNVGLKKAGSATVTITYYYTFSANANPFTNQKALWYKGTCYYTVKVIDPDEKPDKPTVSDIERFRNYVNTTSSSTGAVYMWCDTHDHHAWFDYVTEVEDAYTLGEVVKNDGSVLSASTYPWICVMTLDANKYLAAYNSGLGDECGTHYLKDGQNATETATWYYNVELSKWQYRSDDAPIYIDITHTAPTPKPDVPDKPNGDQIITDLGDAVKDAVKVECVNETGAHSAKTYHLTAGDIGNITAPTKNSDGKYTVNVTIKADEYVKQYSTDIGVSHNLKTGAASSQTIILTYNATDGKWKATGTAPYVTFVVEHEVTPPAPTAPTEDELAQDSAFGVKLKCVTNSKEHGPFDTKAVKGTFTVGEVAGNAQDGYTCEVIIRTDPYVTSGVYVNHCNGVKHIAVAEKVGALLRYDTDGKIWEVVPNKDGVAATIETMCKTETETTVNVVIKPVDREGNEIDGALVRSTDFGAINAADNRFHVGYLTTTQTLSDQTADPEGDGLEESNPVKAFVYQQMAKGDETWHPADGVEQEFTWARQIRFTDLKRESDGTYTLTGQIMFYKLTLDLDGGKLNSGDAAVTYYLSGSEAELPEPSKTGYTFAGWEYKEEDPGDGGVIVMSANEQDNDPAPELTPAGTPIEINYDEEYIARWTVNQYTITFDTDGGTKIDPITQDYGTLVTRPANPTKSGYTFAGWNKTIPSAMPAENMTITALWRSNTPDKDKDDDYTLKYVTNGGKVISSETKSRSWVKDYEDLPTPTRSGYRFEGWYYDTRLTDKVTDDVKVNKTVVTLYARWSSSETPGMLNDEDHFAYVQGYSDGNVHPYGLISRAETTTIFFRLLTDEVRDDNLLTSNTYTDVTNDYWANTAISTMTGLGIVQGRSATTFDPKAPITRAQFAAICARFDTGVSSGSRTFSDISGHWAEKYIERAAELGWIQGFADGTFRPDTYITRAQAMTMINRVLNRTPEDEEDLLEGMKMWPDCNPGDWFYLAVQEATNSHNYKDRGGEVWTKLTRDPDWTRYER